jgi:hypothetical protein
MPLGSPEISEDHVRIRFQRDTQEAVVCPAFEYLFDEIQQATNSTKPDTETKMEKD